jgi:hypothetical protein
VVEQNCKEKDLEIYFFGQFSSTELVKSKVYLAAVLWKSITVEPGSPANLYNLNPGLIHSDGDGNTFRWQIKRIPSLGSWIGNLAI